MKRIAVALLLSASWVTLVRVLPMPHQIVQVCGDEGGDDGDDSDDDDDTGA